MDHQRWEEAEREANETLKKIQENPERFDEVKFSPRQVNALVTLAMMKLGHSEWTANNVCSEMEFFHHTFSPDEVLRRGLILKRTGEWNYTLDHTWRKAK